MRGEPLRERSVALAQGAEAFRILDGGVDLQPVADDPFIGQQALAFGAGEARHAVDLEPEESAPEGLALLEDREPGEPRLVDLQDEPLEEGVVVRDGKAVLLIVIRPVEGMAWRDVAVTHGREVTKGRAECPATQQPSNSVTVYTSPVQSGEVLASLALLVVAVYIVVRQIAAARAERDLRETNQFASEIIENAGEGIVVYDRDLRYI